MKYHIFFLFFFALLITPPLQSASTDAQPSSRQYQMSLQILETIQFAGTEHLLNMTYGQEDLDAYIARKLVPQGLVIGIEPNEDLAENATQDYRGIDNLHIVHMDALYFDFRKTLDIIFSIFLHDWTENDQTIKQVIQNITQSLKSGGMLYLGLDNNNANKQVFIMQTLINSNEYLHVCYEQSDHNNFCLVIAQKK